MKKVRPTKAPKISQPIERWDSLFILYKDREHFRVELHPDLSERKKELERGSHLNNPQVEARAKLAGMLAQVASASRAASKPPEVRTDDPRQNPHNPPVALSAWGFAEGVFSELVETLGCPLIEMFFAKASIDANKGAVRCKKLFAAAVDAIIQDRFPTKSDGSETTRSGEIDWAVSLNARLPPDSETCKAAKAVLAKINKPLVAIEVAADLCEESGKLPSKQKIVQRMELAGVSFSPKSKDLKGKWADVFTRAGLAALPD